MMTARLLWLQDDASASLQPLAARLPDEEQRELAGFAHRERQRNFILSRSLLRHTLARLLDKPASDIRFRRDASGRLLPATTNALHFSLSHSRKQIAIVVAEVPCGVDLEHPRGIDTLRIATRYFAAAEVAWLRELGEAERQRDFFRLWTLKEAAVKALGQGLADNLGRLAFSLAGGLPQPLDSATGLRLWQRQEEEFFLAAAVATADEVEWDYRECKLTALLQPL